MMIIYINSHSQHFSIKIESDKMEIIEVPYNPKELIESIAKVNSVRIEDKPIDYTINIAEDIPYELIGDKLHIKQLNIKCYQIY